MEIERRNGLILDEVGKKKGVKGLWWKRRKRKEEGKTEGKREEKEEGRERKREKGGS